MKPDWLVAMYCFDRCGEDANISMRARRGVRSSKMGLLRARVELLRITRNELKAAFITVQSIVTYDIFFWFSLLDITGWYCRLLPLYSSAPVSLIRYNAAISDSFRVMLYGIFFSRSRLPPAEQEKLHNPTP